MAEDAHGPFIVDGIAIVWCRKHSDAATTMLHYVPVILHLMTPDEDKKIVGVKEGSGYVWAKRLSHATLGWRAPGKGLRITPEKIAH
jgi:hypothetical protein